MALYSTTRFSEIEVSDEDIVLFPNGILGLEHLRKFTILPHPSGGPLEWLQSLEEPNMAFVICEPSLLIVNYEVKVELHEVALIEVEDLSVVKLKVILRVSSPPTKPTVNLLGPLLINPEKNLGMQFIINNNDYSCRYELGA
jgi:flagellar assembly factor FliW